MTQYGFTVDGNPNDDIALRCHLEGAVDDDAAKKACERLVAAADTLPKDGADAARVHVALRSLVSRIRARVPEFAVADIYDVPRLGAMATTRLRWCASSTQRHSKATL
jgi:hypothetical protein